MELCGSHVIIGSLFMQAGALTGAAVSAPHDLRVGPNLTNPPAIDLETPALSWKLKGEETGTRQTAYRIVAASSADLLPEDPDLWDSGKVESDRSVQVPWEGPRLKSRQAVHWAVRVWTGQDSPSAWSETARWEMGLLNPDDWHARWIYLEGQDESISTPCPFFRREFALEGRKIVRARAYVTARGLFEFYVNGERVSEDCFVPGWTDYNVRIQYMTYDVTGLLRDGSNAVGAIVGDGWYCGYLGWGRRRNHYGSRPEFMMQLEVEYEDGASQLLTTGKDWKTATGPILHSDIYDGEMYDPAYEMPGWNSVDFDDSGWKPVSVKDHDSEIQLVARTCPPVRKIQELTPVEVTNPKPGVYVFDLGQNMVGHARIRIRGRKGGLIKLRFAEMLHEDGTLYTNNYRTARSTDFYVCGGSKKFEIWEPRFTFHGFRYVELSGIESAHTNVPDKDTVTGIVLHNDLPETGIFKCSNDKINRLQSNIRWGQKGNFLEVPTDCPQRDERLGWTGDAQVFISTATFNMDVSSFFEKWTRDMRDAQSSEGAFTHVAPNVLGENACGTAGWADAGIICPWTIYLHYGNRQILEENYDAMVRWIDYQQKTSDKLIRPNRGFGDWLSPAKPGTPKDLIGTAYFAYSAGIMSDVAEVLDRPGDQERFSRLRGKIVSAFIERFVKPSGTMKTDNQTSHLLALAFDLLPDNKRDAAEERLAELVRKEGVRLATGFLGTPLLCPELTEMGELGLAYGLLLQEEYPSWLFSINQGATTMWERWNSYSKKDGFGNARMNSFNHYAYGAIGEWMYSVVAGIAPVADDPGYRHVRFQAQPGGNLTWASGRIVTPYGETASHWQIDGEVMEWEVSSPPNTYVTVRFPFGDETTVLMNGAALAEAVDVDALRREDGRIVADLPCGCYRFTLPAPAEL